MASPESQFDVGNSPVEPASINPHLTPDDKSRLLSAQWVTDIPLPTTTAPIYVELADPFEGGDYPVGFTNP